LTCHWVIIFIIIIWYIYIIYKYVYIYISCNYMYIYVLITCYDMLDDKLPGCHDVNFSSHQISITLASFHHGLSHSTMTTFGLRASP
jgi:hypothetical protein